MTILDQDTLARMVAGRPDPGNMASFLKGLEMRGRRAGLHLPHRLAQLIAQVAHESGGFRHDREIWGPTAAQARYDIRTDLGNTPERDGDGYRYRGRGPIQITGADNYRAFTAWARQNFAAAPDFVADPDRVTTDPWEGLVAIWYWESRGLNRHADAGDIEMITRTINGGLNGFADRLARYDRAALVLLGYAPDAVRVFQNAQRLLVDGISGPKTRAALHACLRALPPRGEDDPEDDAGPWLAMLRGFIRYFTKGDGK